VVATCLAPVTAIAVLPDARTALVAERTGRVLRVQHGVDPVLVTTVPVDTTGGGGLTGLVLSPAYAEDRLVYAYATTPTDNRVLRLAPGEEPKPVVTGIPRGDRDNAGALGTDGKNALLVATGSAGLPPDAASQAGKLLRIDTLGRPAPDNPDPASAIYSPGLQAPAGVCVGSATIWVTDRTRARDVIYRAGPGALTEAWS
jgi:glucose/arabinose dehydrogenase